LFDETGEDYIAIDFKPQIFDQTPQIFDASDVTVGGVFLPDSAKEKPIGGEVVSVGPGKREKDGKRKTPQVSIPLVERARNRAWRVLAQHLSLSTRPKRPKYCVVQRLWLVLMHAIISAFPASL
jgi:hypothetical protein